MPNPYAPSSRRSIMLGLAALPLAMSHSAAAAAIGQNEPHPDAALLALAATVPALVQRSHALGREHDRIEEACFVQAGPSPKKPACNPVAFPDFSDFDRAMDAWQADLKARDARLVAAGAALGLKEAERAYNAADQALIDVCEAIAETRAVSLPGLIAKARLAGDGRFADLRDSIVADLLAMGGVA